MLKFFRNILESPRRVNTEVDLLCMPLKYNTHIRMHMCLFNSSHLSISPHCLSILVWAYKLVRCRRLWWNLKLDHFSYRLSYASIYYQLSYLRPMIVLPQLCRVNIVLDWKNRKFIFASYHVPELKCSVIRALYDGYEYKVFSDPIYIVNSATERSNRMIGRHILCNIITPKKI